MGKRSRARGTGPGEGSAGGKAAAPRGGSTGARASESARGGKGARGRGGSRAATPRARGTAALDPVRRTLTAYLFAALVLGVLTLAGILVLGGSLGPFVTLAVVVLAAGLVHREAGRRLAGTPLGDEDRMMQTLAAGMLVICVVLAVAGALVSTLA